MNRNRKFIPNTPEEKRELEEILAQICRHILQERRKTYRIEHKPEQPSWKRIFDKFRS